MGAEGPHTRARTHHREYDEQTVKSQQVRHTHAGLPRTPIARYTPYLTCPLASQETPYAEQGSASVFQPLRTLQLMPLVALYSALRAAISDAAGVSGAAATTHLASHDAPRQSSVGTIITTGTAAARALCGRERGARGRTDGAGSRMRRCGVRIVACHADAVQRCRPALRFMPPRALLELHQNYNDGRITPATRTARRP